MTVMVVMRTSPNGARAQDEDAEDSHESLCQARMRQYRPVLLIVINDEEPQKQETGEETACDPAGRMEVPNRSSHRHRQEKRRGKNIGPTFRCEIHRVRFGGRYQLFTCSHACFDLEEISKHDTAVEAI
jgi:hypothetical protein